MKIGMQIFFLLTFTYYIDINDISYWKLEMYDKFIYDLSYMSWILFTLLL